MPSQTYKALGALLLYPSVDLLEALDELYTILEQDGCLPAQHLKQMQKLRAHLSETDLIDLQEEYVALFDRNRLLSLHLFEHIHGDSRDRGQAMVDLIALYNSKGLDIGSRELPDYLPLFLEFLSQLPKQEAQEYLGDSINVVAALGVRLKNHGSPYFTLLEALQSLTATEPNKEMMRKVQADKVSVEHDLEKIDREWEEKPVNFLANDVAADCTSCPSYTNKSQ